jgi:hypothetical protein
VAVIEGGVAKKTSRRVPPFRALDTSALHCNAPRTSHSASGDKHSGVRRRDNKIAAYQRGAIGTAALSVAFSSRAFDLVPAAGS